MDSPTSNRRRKPNNEILKQIGPDAIGRIPPQAKELEEAVLGAMMLERDRVHEVIEILTPKHFYQPENMAIYEAIHNLYVSGTAIDLLTVSNELRNQGRLDIIGGPYYLAHLTNRVSSGANLEYHARILTQKFIQRELIRVSGEIAVEAYDDTLDSFTLLDDSERKLYEIKNSGLKRNFRSIDVLINQATKELEARQNTETNGITGVASGFSDLDRITSGWQPSDLVILAARPAMGKTAFALSLVRNAAVDFQKKVMIFSLEMADVQLVNRLISAEAEIAADSIKKGTLSEQEWQRLHDKTINLSHAQIFIDDTPQLSIYDLNAKCRRVHSQSGLDMVIIDYLQLLRAETKGQSNREQEIAFISRSLKGLAKELKVPVIALAQLSREVEKRSNKKPQLSDLRESGSIEQDADMVMFLYRDEYYTNMGMSTEGTNTPKDEGGAPAVTGLTEIVIGKNRHGETGSAFAKFVGQYSKFVDLEPEERMLIGREGGGGYDGGFDPGGYSKQQPQFTTMPSKMNSADDINPFEGGSWGMGSGISPNILEDE